MSSDRRSKTSRANLGENIPERLAPEGTTRLTTVIPTTWLPEVDAAAEAAGVTRSAWIRGAIVETLCLDKPSNAAKLLARGDGE